jgi:predicted flap endonuclease-1-like 5' DNA nuclease
MLTGNLLLHIETNCWLWWLLGSLLPFLLGLAVGYLLFSKYRRLAAELEVERDKLKGELVEWEKNFVALKYELDECAKERTRLKTALQSCDADKSILQFKLEKALAAASDAGDAIVVGATAGAGSGAALLAGAAGLGALFANDNLQIIEGIGPKIEELLHANGIRTWSDLAAAKFDRLRQILDDAGSSYRVHNPGSWPEQAALAAAGKWDELLKMQKDLSAGEDTGTGDTDSKLEKLAVKLLGFSMNSSDLKVVEGIGPKIEDLLKADGIKTWSDLAAASTERLQGILDSAGDNFRLADPATWAKQAAMAAGSQWTELKAYQNELTGGKAG